MANFTALKTAIQNAVRQNGNEEITGNVLQSILLSIVTTLGDSAITALENDISSEATTRQNADGVLSDAIDAIGSAVNNGYTYAGIATPSSTPVNAKVFYIAIQAGTYTNYGGQTVTYGITMLKKNGSSWTKDVLLTFDSVPTNESNNPVTSGGVHSALENEAQRAENAFSDLDLSDGTDPSVQATQMTLKLRKNDGTEEIPDWRTLSQVNLPSATNSKAGLMSSEDKQAVGYIQDNPQMAYVVCDTAAATAAKTVALTGYVLPTAGGSVKVKMTYANTVADATLNINGAGAKPLYYNGERAGASNSWEAGEVLDIYYDGTNYMANNVAGGGSDGVFDISHYTGASYADLAAALGTNGANVPAGKRKGGMSVKFINSTTNQYEQWRLMATTWSTTVIDWQGVDAQPTVGSHNLVESGGVEKQLIGIKESIGYVENEPIIPIFELGSIGYGNGGNYASTTRVRTDYIQITEETSISGNHDLFAVYKYDTGKVYLGESNVIKWSENTQDTISLQNFRGYIRIVMRKDTSDSTISQSEVSSFSSKIEINISYSQKIKELNERVDGINAVKDKYFADAIIRTLSASSEESSVGIRLKFIFKVSTGDKIFSRLNVLDKNNFMVIYDTLENAKKSSPVGILQQIYDGYTKHAIFAESEVDGYVSIATKKDNNSAITDGEMQTMIDGMDIYIGPNANFIENENLKKIYFDSYAQNKYSATGIADEDPTRVTCKSVIAVPYPSAELTFVLPPYIKAGIRCSGEVSNLSTNLFWFINGDKVTLPSNARFLIISLAKQVATGGVQPSIFNPQSGASQDENVSVEEVSGYIKRGELYMYYNDRYSGEIVDKNSAEEKYIKAVKYKFTNTLSTNSNPNRLPLLIHTSDVHGDYTRFNRVLDYADYIDADGVLTTGDMSAWNGNSHMDYINDAFKTHKSLGLICVGNHDAFGSNRQVSAQYENVMKASIDKFGYSVNSVDYPTYYYKDIASKLIRVIGLNEFEKTDANANQSYYSQTQINWLISILAATPANYGVIIIMHRPEEAISKIEGYDKFYQDSIPFAQYQSLSITGHPISTIVDAFISKASINIQFTEVNPDTNTNETVNIVADFTGLNTGVEFLFFANGHEHSDRIGVAPNVTNRQLVLNVLSCIGLYDPSHPYYAEPSDMPRGNGSTQDAFNMYAIDRENKQVRIARIGSNKSSMLTDRDYMIVSYV